MTGHARLLAAAALLALAAVQGGASAAEEHTAGSLLVATETMPDPTFAETVIYMVRHDADGALGLVLNRPVDVLPLDEVLRGFGLDPEGTPGGDVTVFSGGPVMPRNGFVLHTGDYAEEGTVSLGDDIAFTPGVAPLRAEAVEGHPRRALLFVGIAGWGPGQLEEELKTEAWTVVPADSGIVFDGDIGTKWRRALDRRGIDL